MGMTTRIARWCAEHPWRTVGAWLVAAVVSIVLAGALLADSLTTESNFVGTPESQKAIDLMKQRLGREEPVRDVVIIRSPTQTVSDPGFRARVEAIHDQLAAAAEDPVRVGPTFYQTHAPSQVSNDQHSTLIAVTMPGDEIDTADKKIAPIVDVVEATNGRGGYQVLATGQATLGRDFTKLSESDLQKGEAIGIPIALLILLAVFGTVVAALIPVVLAIFAIVVAIALAALIGQISPLSFFVVNMITFMGLAVGIDYSLFIVSRYREERRGGHDKLGAIEVAGSTANRAVLFSGMTVVLALVGMLIVPTKIFVSLGAGAILVVLVAVISALTLLPAVLSLLGDRVESLRVPFFGRRAQETTAPHEGFWGRTVDLVMRHRVIAVVASVALLLICAIPYLNINTGAAGLSTLAGQHARQAGIRRPQPRLHRRRGHPRHHRRRRRRGNSRRRPGVPQAPHRTRPRRPLRTGHTRGRAAREPGRDHRPGGRRPQLRRGVERRPRPAQSLPPRRHGRHRAAGLRDRGKRPEPGLLRHHRQVPADRVRAGARPQLHPARRWPSARSSCRHRASP